MQQVVYLQRNEGYENLGVQLLAISPDPVTAWRQDGGALGITVPMLSDPGNTVWMKYGIPSWMMASGEPGTRSSSSEATGRSRGCATTAHQSTAEPCTSRLMRSHHSWRTI